MHVLRATASHKLNTSGISTVQSVCETDLVCTTWILTRDRSWYLADLWRNSVDYPTLKSRVMELSARWKAHRVLVEDASSGTSLVQELRYNVAGLIAVKPDRDKVSRMDVVSAKLEAGQGHCHVKPV